MRGPLEILCRRSATAADFLSGDLAGRSGRQPAGHLRSWLTRAPRRCGALHRATHRRERLSVRWTTRTHHSGPQLATPARHSLLRPSPDSPAHLAGRPPTRPHPASESSFPTTSSESSHSSPSPQPARRATLPVWPALDTTSSLPSLFSSHLSSHPASLKTAGAARRHHLRGEKRG